MRISRLIYVFVLLGGCTRSDLWIAGSATNIFQIVGHAPGLNASFNTNQPQATINGISAGRSYTFSVLKEGADADVLSCSNLPLGASVAGNHINIDFGLRSVAGVLNLACATTEGPFKLTLGINASNFSVVSSNLAESPVTGSNGVQSSDGNFVAYILQSSADSLSQIVLINLQNGFATAVSANGTGMRGDADSSDPQVSANGAFVTFISASTNLVPGISASGYQIYRKDIATGEVKLVSGSGTTPSNGLVLTPKISSDGRYVAFVSSATNLLPGITGYQVYRKDLSTDSIQLVSASGGVSANGTSVDEQLTPDGQTVAFSSTASNLVSGSSGWQIYLRDMMSGSITLVSTSVGTTASRANGAATNSASLSDDGLKVAFVSNATNLVSGASGSQVYLKNLQQLTTPPVLVSSRDGSSGSEGNALSNKSFLSGDGKFVFFQSFASNLLSSGSCASGHSQIFRKELVSGKTQLVSSTDGSCANVAANDAQIFSSPASDGSAITISGAISNFPGGLDTAQIFQKNLGTGTMKLASFFKSSSTYADGSGTSSGAQLTPDGQYAVFVLNGDSLLANALGNQIYRKDLLSGQLELVSSTDETVAHEDDSQNSSSPQITSDGRYVVFTAGTTRWVSGASGDQVYRKDLATGQIVLVSSYDGTSVNQDDTGASYYPSISDDGRYVLFSSTADNWVSGASGSQIYLRDMNNFTSSSITLVSSVDGTSGTEDDSGSSFNPLVSSDGHYGFFLTSASTLIPGASGMQIYRKDLTNGALALVSSLDGTTATEDDGTVNEFQISGNGRFVTFTSAASGIYVPGTTGYQIYQKDMVGGNVFLASSLDGAYTGEDASGTSSSGQSSSDGRYILFFSQATNFVSGASDFQLYRKDLFSGAISLISTTDGTAAGEGSQNGGNVPHLTADGSKALFYSCATNFVLEVNSCQTYIRQLP